MAGFTNKIKPVKVVTAMQTPKIKTPSLISIPQVKARVSTVETNKALTFEKADGYTKSAFEIVASFALSSFNEDTYYQAASELELQMQKAVEELCRTKEGALFAMKTAVYARTISNMRTAPIMVMGTVDKYLRNWPNKKVVNRAISMMLTRVDDAINIVAYIKTRYNQNPSRHMREAIAMYIDNSSEYALAKYKRSTHEWKLADIIKLCRPQGRKELYKQVIENTLKNTDTWEARLSSGEDKNQVFADMINNNKLGYMALMRNINNMVNLDEQSFLKGLSILSDPEQIEKSKQLPFRFFSAWKAIKEKGLYSDDKEKENAIAETLSIAIRHQASLYDVFTKDDKVAILIDTSGSMQCPISEKSTMLRSEVGMALGLALTGVLKDPEKSLKFYTWASTYKDITSKVFKSGKPLVKNLKFAQDGSVGWGTNLNEVMNEVIKTPYTKILVFSDMQLHRYVTGIDKYLKDNNCLLYLFDIGPYQVKPVIAENNIINISGWSESVFRTAADSADADIAATIYDIENSIELYW